MAKNKFRMDTVDKLNLLAHNNPVKTKHMPL